MLELFLVQARGSQSSMSVGTDGALATLKKMDELRESGMRDVTVRSAQGEPFTRDEIEIRARDEASRT